MFKGMVVQVLVKKEEITSGSAAWETGLSKRENRLERHRGGSVNSKPWRRESRMDGRVVFEEEKGFGRRRETERSVKKMRGSGVGRASRAHGTAGFIPASFDHRPCGTSGAKKE